MNDALQHLGPQLMALASQAHQAVQADVDDIIRRGDHDTDRIDHQLDIMLGFCYAPDMVVVFKQLCRYYFTIDPVATAGHINAYREMWDGPEEAAEGGVV